MAVYKPTYCEPFLANFDARVTSKEETQYFRCHIESSNKDITGYSVRILDQSNNQIFPVDSYGNGMDTNGNPIVGKISPVKELQDYINNLTLENTGLNGTYLSIPFIQNQKDPLIASYNAIYYIGDYKANYVLKTNVTEGTPDYIGPIIDPNKPHWIPQPNGQLTYGG